MPKLANLLNDSQAGFSFDASAIMNRDLVEITIARGSSDLDVQCVRIVPNSMGSQGGQTVANNTPSQASVVVIGDSDLDMRKGDLFTFRSTRYKVLYVTSAIPGHVQAVAEGTQ